MSNHLVHDEIINSYQIKKRLVPFIGSGFTRNIESYPDWNDFVAILKAKLKLSASEGKAFDNLPNNLEKTELFVRREGKKKAKNYNASTYSEYKEIYKKGRKSLLTEINSIFDKSKNQFDTAKWSTHSLLVQKFPKIIYTTNWDDTLERDELYTITGLSPKPNYAFSKEGDDDGNPRIIKYHGDASDDGEEMLVACLTDYHRRMTFTNCLDIKFKSDLLRYDFLLLGYSFTDPNIHLMIHQLSEIVATTNETIGGNQLNTKIYMVVLEEPDDLRVNLLRDTFSNLKVYHLLDNNDYIIDPATNKSTPIPINVKNKMEQLLNSL